MKDRGYWVWNPNFNKPGYRHDTIHSAITEAERLARMNPGEQFIVLHAIGSAKVEPQGKFKSTTDEVPF